MLERLNELRKRANVTQKELADNLQVSQQSINKYENHHVQPDLAILARMAEYFGVSVDYLIGCSDVPYRAELALDLTADDLYMLNLIHKLTPAERDSILLVIQNYMRNRGESSKKD